MGKVPKFKGTLIDVRGRVYRDGPKSQDNFNPDPEHVNDQYYSDFDGDAWNNLNEFVPPRPDPHAGPRRPSRKAVADATRFFRRFDKSKLREVLMDLGKDGRERADLLKMAIDALGEGLPTKEAMDRSGEILRMMGLKPGDKLDPSVFVNLVGATKFWNKVPEQLTYLVRRHGEPIIVPSDEPEFNCKLGQANILDLPREMFWMDDELFYEAYARNALTKFEWDRRIWEPTHVKVTFIVDVSGSMAGDPMLIATACALKLSKIAEENGHEVSVVFFATAVSKEYTPREAFLMKGIGELGAGTNIEGAIRRVYESKPDAYVLCTDFQVHTPTKEAKEMLKPAQVFGMLPCPSLQHRSVGTVQMNNWVVEPSKRLFITT